MVARKILCLTSGLFVFVLLTVSDCLAQDRAIIGIVKNSIKKPLKEVEVSELRHRKQINDLTNGEGLYCVKIPDKIKGFQLSYRLEGYLIHVDLEPVYNSSDPIKRKEIILISISDIQNMSAQKIKKLTKQLTKWTKTNDLITHKTELIKVVPELIKITGYNIDLVLAHYNKDLKAELSEEINSLHDERELLDKFLYRLLRK